MPAAGNAFVGKACQATPATGIRRAARAGRVLLGDALALLACAAWGATTVTIRCSVLAGAPATETPLLQLLGAFAVLLPAAWLTGQWRFEPLRPSGHTCASRAWSSLSRVSSPGAGCCAATRLATGRVLVSDAAVRVVFGVWLLGESLERRFVAGSGLVLAAIGLVSGHAALARDRMALRRPARRPLRRERSAALRAPWRARAASASHQVGVRKTLRVVEH
jgi:drug/metabolite transporter (DMT)-like permease